MRSTKRLPSILAAALALALAAPLAANAAVDYFLKVDGIPGEATQENHRNEINVLSFSLGASRDATGKKGSVCVRDISFTKFVDKASPLLLADAVSGLVIPTAVLTARKAGEGQKEFLRIELKDVLVSSVQQSGSGGSDSPIESVSLSFGSLNLSYRPQDDKGGLGDPVQATVKGGGC